VIDTDRGVDDTHTIMAAFAHPEAQVEAITTVTGNVSLEPDVVRKAETHHVQVEAGGETYVRSYHSRLVRSNGARAQL
jgi:inosine-uridine nucleoside N-ribohydrolase